MAKNNSYRAQTTSYTGSDRSVSISQTQTQTQTQSQDADQSQHVLTNDRLRGEWSPRAIVERRYDARNDRPERLWFIPISIRGPLYAVPPEHGESFIIGYALVRPGVNTTVTEHKPEVFEQFADKDEAYVWKHPRPTYLPEEKLTPRFVIEGYGYNHRQPTDSTWGGKFYVKSADAMLTARDGFRVAAVIEMPPGTEFPYPFGDLDSLADRVDDDGGHCHINPDFRRVA